MSNADVGDNLVLEVFSNTVGLKVSILAKRFLKGKEPVGPPIHAREQMLGDLEVLRQFRHKLFARRKDTFLHQPVERSVLEE